MPFWVFWTEEVIFAAPVVEIEAGFRYMPLMLSVAPAPRTMFAPEPSVLVA